MARKRKPKLGDIVEIFWNDASADDDTHSLKNIKTKKPYLCKRKVVGYYVLTADGFVVLCGDITLIHGDMKDADAEKDENYASLLNIPEGMITSLRVLESSSQGKQTRKGRT
jgi:hypothetical protein